MRVVVVVVVMMLLPPRGVIVVARGKEGSLAAEFINKFAHYGGL